MIILAAGKGTRMRSQLPKVLHLLAGQPLLAHLFDTVQTLAPRHLFTVIGHQAEQIQQTFASTSCQWILQTTQQGTGHAVAQVLPYLPNDGQTLILYGDIPLITLQTLEKLIEHTPTNGIGVLTAIVDLPLGFGRIVRDNHGKFAEVVEDADANPEQSLIDEINAGIYVIPNTLLHELLPKLDNNNTQQEFYLPPLLTLAHQQNVPIITINVTDTDDIHGINNRQQLAQAERILQKRIAAQLANNGATIIDPNRLDVRGKLNTETDVTIDVNVIFSGNVSIGTGSYIGPHSVLTHSRIGKNVTIKSHCVIDGADIADNCVIGPFAHIRPDTVLEPYAKIGNFVELKKTHLGAHSKVNHLSYVGDAQVGKEVNIGAGTITCNYDGVNKHATHIGDHASIGANSSLVAPVTIGESAVIGAGSVITKEAPAGQLTLSRSEQRTLARRRPKKSE
ncbi:MAG: bifunctional UDP-N-acetylglucosamine diphosphorylase/glucosamine-1-phosphate N-acetyltransferase GlmU [Gammaproteobacteria bacterium]